MKIIAEALSPPADDVAAVRRVADLVGAQIEDTRDWLHNYVRAHVTRFAFDIHHVENFMRAEKLRVVDLAAAPFLTSAVLSARGRQVTAVDIAPERFSGLGELLQLDVRRCNIESDPIPLTDEHADAILFFEIFEHLRINPIFTFSEIARVLKPDGLVFLSTPNLKSLKGLVNLLFHSRAYSCTGRVYEEYSKLEKFGHMGHVREYTSREVTEFARHFQLECECVVYRGSFDQPLARALTSAMPRLRPFQMLVLRKVAS